MLYRGLEYDRTGWPRPGPDTTLIARERMHTKEPTLGFFKPLYQTTKRVDICFAGYVITFVKTGDTVRRDGPIPYYVHEDDIENLRKLAKLLIVLRTDSIERGKVVTAFFAKQQAEHDATIAHYEQMRSSTLGTGSDLKEKTRQAELLLDEED